MEQPPTPSGILLVDKPLGQTSFQAVEIASQRLAQALGVRRVKAGHAGTLDPLATGLLVVAIGSATKRLADLTNLSKSYDATIVLGETTDTLDAEGVVTDTASAAHISPGDISPALESLLGEHLYPVPLYSAVKVDGRPLYWYARNGQTPPRIPEKPMSLLSFSVQNSAWRELPDNQREITVTLEVSKGTYIRTLAAALGQKLGVPARLSGLRRVTVGDFSVADAALPDAVTETDVRPL